MAIWSVWMLGDQLLAQHPVLEYARAQVGMANVRVVLIESAARLARRPSHRQKLALVLSALRHYAAELREAGWLVELIQAPTMLSGLHDHIRRHQPQQIVTMAAAEYAARQAQQRIAPQLPIALEIRPNTQFLVGQFDPFPHAPANKTVIMEQFYRAMRKHYQVLLNADRTPIGGQWNYDAENRKALPKTIAIPALRRFAPDAITSQALAEAEQNPHGIGSTASFGWATTRQEALLVARQFLQICLGDFGRYEDAMSSQHERLFHSTLSPYLNLGLLEPLELIRMAEAAYQNGMAPLNSVEGFIRQILGWREYIYWQYWRQMPWLAEQNAWHAERPLPAWFWDANTPMNCLQHAIGRALNDGYNHHIERLMLICNFAVLAGLNPQHVNDWFMASYIDAYDWVMQPNVIGMGLNADGGRIATKPYIASANYINTMSDYCAGCRYNPKARSGSDACPFNLLYWNFLITHEARLRANPRFGPAVLGLKHIPLDQRQIIQAEANHLLEHLCAE
ncbi:MAG: cryptochrome/photolyase family protein [Roseiflexaceae bacterium]